MRDAVDTKTINKKRKKWIFGISISKGSLGGYDSVYICTIGPRQANFCAGTREASVLAAVHNLLNS